jgi:ubiquinol-cytochrome c reductase cytochrome c subunit
VRRIAEVVAVVALVCAASVILLAPSTGFGQDGSAGSAPASDSQIARGRSLFVEGCSSCHGFAADGIRGVAPSLHGVGAAAADFYLRTGRMPLSAAGQEPQRRRPAYSSSQIADLVAYVGSLGGPPVPHVDTAGASLSRGQQLFADSCSGCHQAAARGGIVTGAFVPSLVHSTPTQIAEAVRIGPFLMPRFGPRALSDQDVADIARYVAYLHAPPDHGGWGIGHIGPVPEGMVTWLVAIAVLLLVTRLIGERTER